MATPEEMDVAAEQAAEDLETLDREAVKIISTWWRKWFMKTGHKRLGRALVALDKVGGVRNSPAYVGGREVEGG